MLQSLGEKGLLKTRGGEACFSVLLFQDLSVIPILAVLPLLGTGAPVAQAPVHGLEARIAALPGWAHPLLVLAAVVVGGRFAAQRRLELGRDRRGWNPQPNKKRQAKSETCPVRSAN